VPFILIKILMIGSIFQPLVISNNSNLQWVFNVLIEKFWLLTSLAKPCCYFSTTQNKFQIFFCFLCFFLARNCILVTRLWPECGQINRKILIVEMVTKIKLSFLTIQKQFKGFLLRIFFLLATEFRSLDCD
jgi:hypothetical protein